MSSTAPDTNSLTLHGLPVVNVPGVGTGDLSFLSIPSNYTAVINNELWLVNEDPNTGVKMFESSQIVEYLEATYK